MQNKLYELPCPVCGVVRSFSTRQAYGNAKRKDTACRKCCCRGRKVTYYKDIPSMWFSTKRAQAKYRGKKWYLKISDLQEIYEKQGKVCALTKLPIGWAKKSGPHRSRDKVHRYSVSIDRIDSKRSYCKDNVQLVHKNVNIMKHKTPMREFVHFCKLVYLTNKHLVDD